MVKRGYQRLDWVVMAFCILLLGYISWQTQQGPRGVGYSESLTAKVALLSLEHQAMAKRNATFDSRVKLLRPESIDPDLVDELARRNLGLAKANDIVVLTGP